MCQVLYCTTERCYHLKITVTCNIVSKLKVSPFHKVNSPLEAPVTKRLPSGVHWGRKKDRLHKATNFQPSFLKHTKSLFIKYSIINIE